ncbi:MAG: chromosome segregation protein SMC [Gammaproteobacteria bacterium]
MTQNRRIARHAAGCRGGGVKRVFSPRRNPVSSAAMRLSKIKISGFKSFVDSTILSLPGNLTGVVGPNGCGKSNIIDAINWVMGESSAKHLRGESMADVIFNGSNTRKPVGQASVEIVFDNGDGALGGQYASYAEIAIKRTLARDGVSTYWLNGVRCRRKDITDMFLGTGVGARSYSVIEQGTVSRVVEARPEELRVFLEEAAGISKYKERRRDTENRIRHTRENLERLTDIRDELSRQIGHLERQSKAAARYQELKVEERRVQSALLAVRWRDVDAAARAQGQGVQRAQTDVDAATADLRSVETAMVRLREDQVRATEEFNQRQGEFYRIGAEISRTEQALRHAEERREQLRRDIAQVRADAAAARDHVASDERGARDLAAQLQASEPQAAAAGAEERESHQHLDQCEQRMQAWQQEWDAFNAQAAAAMQAQRLQEARVEHLQQDIGDAEKRITTLHGEMQGLRPDELAARVDAFDAELATLTQAHAEGTRAQDERSARLQAHRQAMDAWATDSDRLRERERALGARCASLEALQQAAMSQNLDALGSWLAARGLADAKRLAQLVEVDSGWEVAMEAAVRLPLDTLCVDGVDAVLERCDERPGGRVSFIERNAPAPADGWIAAAGPALRDRVRAPAVVHELLAGVYAAQDQAEARAIRDRLGPGECVVVRDGTVHGRGWARLAAASAVADSVLARERELGAASAELRELQAQIAGRVEALARLREEAGTLQEELSAQAIELRGMDSRRGALQADLASTRARHEHVSQRRTRIEEELAQLGEQLDMDRESLDDTRRVLGHARGSSADLSQRRAGLEHAREGLRQSLQQARDRWRRAHDAMHAIALRQETLRSQRSALERNAERHQERVRQLEGRAAEIEQSLGAADSPIDGHRMDLERQFVERGSSESRLGDARRRLEDIDAELRAQDAGRAAAEQALQARRADFERIRMELHGLNVRMQDLAEQARAADLDIASAAAGLAPDADEAQCRADLESIERRVARLGAINLAAIEEFAQVSERKAYLDNQHADLTEALNTLEEAIRKIDRETRTRFKETYDKVNGGLQQIFPVLFGGGHAYLEMTGEDLLETGVAVMARPPGKRNSTIHLLSGGEKALTAFALIVAIFDLNPAPFCLLDEVDAPLDDTNVQRFCDLIKSMAGRVQFLFVTHNKITMELADQLIGVTMQEPGVSRLVAVNVEEAVQMAAIA